MPSTAKLLHKPRLTGLLERERARLNVLSCLLTKSTEEVKSKRVSSTCLDRSNNNTKWKFVLSNYTIYWLDFHLKKLLHLLPCYLRDSNDLLRKLRELGTLPPGAKLFSADAISMYTNIDFDHAIEEITLWFKRLAHDGCLPAEFPTKAVLAAMRIVMTNNVFQWEDCYFLQLQGTAMGTSSACMWATIYYAVHEVSTLATRRVSLLPLSNLKI